MPKCIEESDSSTTHYQHHNLRIVLVLWWLNKCWGISMLPNNKLFKYITHNLCSNFLLVLFKVYTRQIWHTKHLPSTYGYYRLNCYCVNIWFSIDIQTLALNLRLLQTKLLLCEHMVFHWHTNICPQPTATTD